MRKRTNGMIDSPAVMAVFGTLVEGWHCAQQLDTDVWDFAVSAEELKALGSTCNIIRWLVMTRYAEAAVPGPGPKRRLSKMPFFIQDDALFVLTESGLRFAAGLDLAKNGRSDRKPTRRHQPRPRFRNRVLSVGDQVIKKFRQPAKVQELILLAFEEQRWEREIDDPLPPEPEIDPKLRLRRTIDNLNRHQHLPLLHFYGDGTGERVGWEWRG